MTEGGFELILLGFPLCAEFATLGLAIQVRPGTVIKSGALIFPNPGVGIAVIGR